MREKLENSKFVKKIKVIIGKEKSFYKNEWLKETK